MTLLLGLLSALLIHAETGVDSQDGADVEPAEPPATFQSDQTEPSTNGNSQWLEMNSTDDGQSQMAPPDDASDVDTPPPAPEDSE
jgi:hypothetical protein